MEDIIFTLHHSNDNDARKLATIKLTHLQNEQPEEFMTYTWDRVSNTATPPEDRFFVSTLVSSFVQDSWRSTSTEAFKKELLVNYTQLVISEHFTSVPLCRKLGEIIANMARLGPKSRVPGNLPEFVEIALNAYLAVLQKIQDPSFSPDGYASISQVLLLLHVLLKEIHRKRIGKLFEQACQFVAPSLSLILGKVFFSPITSEAAFHLVLHALKCASRVFGCGLFDQPFCWYLLAQAWELAQAQQTPSAFSTQYMRLMDYVLKIFFNVVSYFPTQMQLLGLDFFAVQEAVSPKESSNGTTDRSLMRFLSGVVQSSGEGSVIISVSAASRAMSILTLFFQLEAADPFFQTFLERFTATPQVSQLLEYIMVHFLPDHCTQETIEIWRKNPEITLEDLDVEYGEEDSTMSCAEQLFLSFTECSCHEKSCLTEAWRVVNRLLDQGGEEQITAALHSVGIGFNTMSENSGYITFLQEKLLPILWSTVNAGKDGQPKPVSEFVLRRVVWLIGMWCESVEEVPLRIEVHTALGTLLKSGLSAAIGLVALRTVENFVSDNHFTPEELPADLPPLLFAAIQSFLPQLRSPTAVKQIVGLIYVLLEKCSSIADGDAVLELLVPITHAFIAQYLEKVKLSSSDAFSEDNEGEEANLIPSVLRTLLECLGSAVQLSSGNERMWDLMPIVVACTEPGEPLSAWLEEEGWELSLEIARAMKTYGTGAEQALQWCLHHMQRDFPSLPTLLTLAATLVLMRPSPVEDIFTVEMMSEWMRNYVQSTTNMTFCTAYLGLFLSVMVSSQGALRLHIAESSLRTLSLWPTDVQGPPQPLHLSLLVSLSLKDPTQLPYMINLLKAEVERRSEGGPDFIEKVLLLMDVSTNIIFDNGLRTMLKEMVKQCSLTPSDSQGIQEVLIRSTPSSNPDEIINSDDKLELLSTLLTITSNEMISLKSHLYERLITAFSILLY